MRLQTALLALAFNLAGCASPPRELARPANIGAGAAFAELVPTTRFLFRLTTPADDGRPRATEGTGVQLAPDLILTAAHCVPETVLWDGEPDASIFVDDTRRSAALVSSGLD